MTNPNDTAYPFQDNGTTVVPQLGLTKLEMFSAMILQGFCSFPVKSEYPGDLLKDRATSAVDQAKALIEALNKEGK